MLSDSVCPICQGGPVQPWMQVPGDWRREGHREPYDLRWCADCRYGLLWPRPTPQAARAAYDVDDYYTHRPLNGTRQTPAKSMGLLTRLRIKLAWLADAQKRLTVDWFRDRLQGSRQRVLEIGCGNASKLKWIVDNLPDVQVVGVEPDEAARKQALAQNLQVHVGTAEHLPSAVRGERYDVVLMTHVLEHCLDPRQALANAASVLEPGGTLVVEVPNHDALGLRWAGPNWYWLDVPRHLNFFTGRSLKALAHQCGLQTHQLDYVGYTRQFSEPWMAQEVHIADRLALSAVATRRLRNWSLLLSTLFAKRAWKYDSIRLYATVAAPDPALEGKPRPRPAEAVTHEAPA